MKSKVLQPLPDVARTGGLHQERSVEYKTEGASKREYDAMLKDIMSQNVDGKPLGERRAYFGSVFQAGITGKELSNKEGRPMQVPDIDENGQVKLGVYANGKTMPKEEPAVSRSHEAPAPQAGPVSGQGYYAVSGIPKAIPSVPRRVASAPQGGIVDRGAVASDRFVNVVTASGPVDGMERE